MMTIQIITGFMGAGKTTFLNHYLPILDGRMALIENEPGEEKLNIPNNKEITIYPMAEGCICCSLAIEFQKVLQEIKKDCHPDLILIKPSGISKLSDIVRICSHTEEKLGTEIQICGRATVVDLSSFDDYMDGFGAFYQDQIENASIILCSHIEEVGEEIREEIFHKIQKMNPEAVLYLNDWRSMKKEEWEELCHQMKNRLEEEKEEKWIFGTIFTDKKKMQKSGKKITLQNVKK